MKGHQKGTQNYFKTAVAQCEVNGSTCKKKRNLTSIICDKERL
jgi:hypothetical protein